MGRTKDRFWVHAHERENVRFVCKYCHCEFAGGISRVKSHLSGRRGNDIQVCKEVPKDVQLEVLEELDAPKEKERQVKISKKKRKDREVENENYAVPSSSGVPNLCLDNVLMTQKLAKLFYSFGIHPEVIWSPIFEDFVKSIFEYGPSSYRPGCTFYGWQCIEGRVKNEVADYLHGFRIDPVHASCTLMVTIRAPDSFFEPCVYVNIFAYSKKGLACFGSYKIEQSLAGFQEFVSSKIGYHMCRSNLHVVQLLLSKRELNMNQEREFHRNMDKEWMNIKNYYDRSCVSHCAIYEIDMFFEEVESVLTDVIKLLFFIFNAYHYYNLSSRRGTKVPKEKYAFIFHMLNTILEIEDELQDHPFSSIIEASDCVKMLDEQGKAKHFGCAKFIDYIVGSKEFWRRVKAVEQVWFLLLQTRCLVNCVNSSIGYLYQMIERLKDGIEKSRQYDHFVYDHIWETFIQMRSKIIHPMHAAAVFLDPAYMCTKYFVENHEMINGTKYMLENLVDSIEKEAFEKELDLYREELPTLTTAQFMIRKLKTLHPRTWWDDYYGKHTPVLKKYAIQILAQPCSTSLCKQYEMPLGNWGEDMATKVNTMIINRNFTLLEFEPIIFDKLVEDHDAFKELMELDHECHINNILETLSSEVEVNFMINPSPPFWDDVYEIFWCFDFIDYESVFERDSV